jgi:yecA family protein
MTKKHNTKKKNEPLSDALSVENLQKLSEFLGASNEGCAPMSLTKFHGFLTAIYTAPQMIMPSLWTKEVFGGDFNFESKEQIMEIMTLLMSWSNSVVDGLRQQYYVDDANYYVFEPLIFEGTTITPYATAPITLVGEWCDGYLSGVALDALWREDEEGGIEATNGVPPLLTMAILAGHVDIKGEPLAEILKGFDGDAFIKDEPTLKEAMREMVKKLIFTQYMKWKEERNNSFNHNENNTTYRHTHPKIGRNDLCYCGSGVKYKKCCAGEEPTVH